MRISDWSSDVCSSDLSCVRYPALMRKGRDMAKVVCVLYDDPINGYPTSYARDGLPEIHTYPDGQTLPTPKAIDFTPGHLPGSVSGELGLRQSLASQGHKLGGQIGKSVVEGKRG